MLQAAICRWVKFTCDHVFLGTVRAWPPSSPTPSRLTTPFFAVDLQFDRWGHWISFLEFLQLKASSAWDHKEGAVCRDERIRDGAFYK